MVYYIFAVAQLQNSISGLGLPVDITSDCNRLGYTSLRVVVWNSVICIIAVQIKYRPPTNHATPEGLVQACGPVRFSVAVKFRSESFGSRRIKWCTDTSDPVDPLAYLFFLIGWLTHRVTRF